MVPVHAMTDENVFYSIRERLKDTGPIDLDDLMQEINSDIDAAVSEQEANAGAMFASGTVEGELRDVWAVEFSTNYTVSDLARIMEYYGISRRKLRKDEMIQALVTFEECVENQNVVERRRRLWENMEELKEDSILSKYISF